jgi:hypothetical protein
VGFSVAERISNNTAGTFGNGGLDMASTSAVRKSWLALFLIVMVITTPWIFQATGTQSERQVFIQTQFVQLLCRDIPYSQFSQLSSDALALCAFSHSASSGTMPFTVSSA